MPRERKPRGPGRQQPVSPSFPGINCASQCGQQATVWSHLNYWCDRHKPTDHPSNCTHPHTMTRHGRTTCSWCCLDTEEPT